MGREAGTAGDPAQGNQVWLGQRTLQTTKETCGRSRGQSEEQREGPGPEPGSTGGKQEKIGSKSRRAWAVTVNRVK